MPGIVGIISQKLLDVECEALVAQMVATMDQSSLYGSGTFSCQKQGVYAGWVAHKNSFSANQVFLNEQRDIVILFSGECFPDSDIKSELRRKGHYFGETEGDWLPHLYEEKGNQFWQNLNGLFSGLLIDIKEGKAFLFSDRYGTERIYWHETPDAFYFGSEAKALLRILPELRTFDEEGVIQLLRLGCTEGTRTLFHGISLLPPASLWSFDGIRNSRQKYFSLETWETQVIGELTAFSAEFEGTFKRIVQRYFRSNAKIGISLTAGLDGRMIMACLPELIDRPVCYTFAGEAADLLDARLAERVARVCGLDHHVLRIASRFFADFSTYADRTVYLSDGCLGPLGAHELYLNEQARQLAPVRLTGVFGGEVLREVSFSKPLYLEGTLLNPEWTRALAVSEQRGSDSAIHPITSSLSHEIPQRRFGVIATGRSQTIFRTPYLDNGLVALAYRTPPSLRASPGPAFALIRRNNEKLSEIPTDMGFLGGSSGIMTSARRTFAKTMFKLDHFYSEGLPKPLTRFDRFLNAFGSTRVPFGRHTFLHYRRWFQRELGDYVRDAVREAAKRQSGIWNSRYVIKMMEEHLLGKKNHTLEINAVLTLEATERLLFAHSAGHADRVPASAAPSFASIERAAS
jgi:asparagine synthase (glutamine-hydrolysing)